MNYRQTPYPRLFIFHLFSMEPGVINDNVVKHAHKIVRVWLRIFYVQSIVNRVSGSMWVRGCSCNYLSFTCWEFYTYIGGTASVKMKRAHVILLSNWDGCVNSFLLLWAVSICGIQCSVHFPLPCPCDKYFQCHFIYVSQNYWMFWCP